MTLKYRMIVERYLEPNEVIGNSIPNREIFSLLDEKISRVIASLMYSNWPKKILNTLAIYIFILDDIF